MPRRRHNRRLVGAMRQMLCLSVGFLAAGGILGLVLARLTIPFIFGATP